MQWVVGLDYEVGTEKLTAATENAVFIVDTNVSEHAVVWSCFSRIKICCHASLHRHMCISRALPTPANTRPLLLGRCIHVCLYMHCMGTLCKYLNCSVILFSSFGYLVLSFKDGSISVRLQRQLQNHMHLRSLGHDLHSITVLLPPLQVMNTVLHTVIQELSGHIRAVTGILIRSKCM